MNIVSILLSIVGFVLASYIGIFVMWKRIEQEHVEESGLVFDTFFQSVVLGYMIGKAAHILLSLRFPLEASFLTQTNMLILSTPFMFVGTLLTFYLRTKDEFRDRLHVLDVISPALAVWMGMMSVRTLALSLLSLFTAQDAGVLVAPIMLSLISAIFFFLSAHLLGQLELRYRTFTWYRYRRSSAQSGFVIACYLILMGILSICIAIASGNLTIAFAPLMEFFVYLLLIVTGFVILYVRSGRWKAK